MSDKSFVRSCQSTHSVQVMHPQDCLFVTEGRDEQHVERSSVVRLLSDGRIYLHVTQHNGLVKEHAQMSPQEFNKRLLLLVLQYKDDEAVNRWCAAHLAPTDEHGIETL